jgi:glycosyltransferase involved in cell wall biosynthesis
MDVTVITVNFKTPELIGGCISSFQQFYPHLRYVVVDNGGCVESLRVLRGIGTIELVENPQNIGHGPALHQGISLSTTRYVFTLDSDTTTHKGGFMERMLSVFEGDPKLFALGWLRYTNESGVASPKQELKRGMKYVHPHACLLDREKYGGLHPFIHSGAPATRLMMSAAVAGYGLESFPVEEYIEHKVAGTRGKFGGQCKVDTDARPGKWRMHRI